MYAISRHERRPGYWYWAVLFTSQGKLYHKSFYDIRRGGTEKALAAAIQWRDEQLAKIKALSMRQFCEKVRTTNTSGVSGVRLIHPQNQPMGAWQAQLRLPSGKLRTRTFSIKLHGGQGAFELAVEARKQFLDEAEDRPYLHSDLAKSLAPGDWER